MQTDALELNQAVEAAWEKEGENYSCQAGVVRIDPDGAGFAFRGLEKSDRKRIENFIKSLR
jgi:hypothetical protein